MLRYLGVSALLACAAAAEGIAHSECSEGGICVEVCASAFVPGSLQRARCAAHVAFLCFLQVDGALGWCYQASATGNVLFE